MHLGAPRASRAHCGPRRNVFLDEKFATAGAPSPAREARALPNRMSEPEVAVSNPEWPMLIDARCAPVTRTPGMRCSTIYPVAARFVFQCPPTSIPKTQKKSARKIPRGWGEIWLHCKEKSFQTCYYGWPRTRRWIFAEKVLPKTWRQGYQGLARWSARRPDPPSRCPGPDAALINAETSRP